ncbi:hypothetical protein C1H46_041913 [Malus baccata]|uniref:Uncharacterized protein n=1 Tax=Malus baccata TaxID=106549 RepID=A0A540KEA0_MALBA|nr:hypothetical protein C1H46_041913 [Malus baccata]
MPSISLASTSDPPSRVFVDEPLSHDDLPLTVPSRSKERAHPPLVIRPSIDQIALPSNTSGLRNTNYAFALLEAAITPVDFK